MARLPIWMQKVARSHSARFLLLWLVGVAGMALLALPFHLLVMAAKS
ncbi:hypothetical protein H9K76_08430 [Diaphorobacter ruginosibacter]|uniref:Uncharacterized protein n=1 Tax=Diaphorobacter ruginosibacter TaxID=1715720 RepID=A0A7G9RT94_9BURK|nr:hypothetical protein [Diaphorobacter ruginosibacter]QNN58819.1 hypothetical protein H9K76_08430 [Diaphorobacter ruginosibacter]